MELIAENLRQYAPKTNLYRIEDNYVLITVPDELLDPVVSRLPADAGMKVTSVVDPPTEVFLADKNGRLVDADGDPTNGMTPLVRLPAGTSHEEALELAEKYLAVPF